MAEQGRRSVVNVVFIVLLAAALAGGVYAVSNMASAAMSGPATPPVTIASSQ